MKITRTNSLLISFLTTTALLILTAMTPCENPMQTDQKAAEKIAKDHYYKYASGDIRYEDIIPELAYTGKENNNVIYYAFNINQNKGFVIVSVPVSDNSVIGYSFTGRFAIPDSSVSPEYLIILKTRSEKAKHIGKTGISQSVNKDLLIKDETTKAGKGINNKEPLIKTKWGQGEYYNDSVPEINGTKMPVGCVATAVAQVMKYYNFPPAGSGKNFYEAPVLGYKVKADFAKTQYQWDLMPDELTGPNRYVAQLCYHVGVGASTDYTPMVGSMASLYRTGFALRDYFNYSDEVKYTGYATINEWKNTLIEQLDNNEPVLMQGSDPELGGHTFICDGYQDDYFHINFGWNGSADGYYNIEDINGFNQNRMLLINVRPPEVTFSVSNLSPELNEIISLQPISKHSITSYQWEFSPENIDFVNGTNSTSILPQVVFKNTGTYNIRLTVQAEQNEISIEKTVNVSFMLKNRFGSNAITACHQSAPIKWFDYDNDGDLDLIQLIISRVNGSQTLLFENNNGIFEKTDDTFTNSYNGSISTFDYNNDSYLDVFIMEPLNSIKTFKNIAGHGFQEVFLNLPELGGGTIIPGDINNDGCVDILAIGKNGTINENLFHYYVYKNLNGIFSMVFEDYVEIDQMYRNDNIADFADLDNDGDLDIVIHEVTAIASSNGIKILINDKGSFVEANQKEQNKYISENLGEGAVVCGDFDNDRDIDILSASESGISILLNSDLTFSRRIVNSTGSYWYRTECTDFNNDGNLDLFSSTENKSTIYYSHFPDQYTEQNILNSGIIGIDSHSGDYNNDGYSDIGISEEIYRNNQGKNLFAVNTPPAAPSNLKHSFMGSAVLLTWDKSIDNQTPQDGLSYNLMIGTSPDKMDIMAPHSDIYSGKRKIVKMGNVFLNSGWYIRNLKRGTYYWSVQAVDNAYQGGMFAPIQSFSITDHLYALPENQNTSSDAGSIVFKIISSTSWTITENSPWLTVSPASGTGDGTITVNCLCNTSLTRTATLTLSGTNLDPRTITVTQTGSLNSPPDKPILIIPANNSTVGRIFTLLWNCSDPDVDDELYYNLRIRIKGTNEWQDNLVNTRTYYNVDVDDSDNNLTIEWYIIASDGKSESSSDIWEFTINTTTEARVIFDYPPINVYPNPVRDILYLESERYEINELTLQIWSMTGILVYTESIEIHSDNFKKSINVSNLNKGVYILRMTIDNRSFYRKILIE